MDSLSIKQTYAELKYSQNTLRFYTFKLVYEFSQYKIMSNNS